MEERRKVRAAWIKLHPANFDGYYYCHICGGWVNESIAQLDHIVPSSLEKIDMDEEGWDDKLRMSHPFPVEINGKVACIGNSGKGSTIIESTTREIAPPDDGS